VLFEYRNDEYRILLRNSDWRGGATPDFPATNYIVAVDVRNATGVFGSYGLSFGISNDFSQYYVFEIYPDGIYAIWNYDTGNWTLLAEGQSGSINLGTASKRLKVERNGATIAAYANGQLLTTVSDNSFIGSREMGLVAFSYDQPGVDIRFDNFVVYPTDYPSSCGTPSALAATNSMGNRQSLDGALSDGGVTRPNQAGR
jgi:hypothetical protein